VDEECAMLEARTFYSFGQVAVCALLAVFAGDVAGCAVDDRTLLELDDDGGAVGTGARDGAGGAGASRTEEDATPPPRCIYPADESKADCHTLVQNAGFHADSSHWLKEYDSIFLSWSRADAAANNASGSITVLNTHSGDDIGFADAGARQCLTVTPGTTIVVGADVFIVGGEHPYGFDASPGPDKPKAGLSILFYELEGCRGGSDDDSFTPPLTEAEDAWIPIGGSKVAPDKAVSMAVRLIAMKPFQQLSMQVHFDNVLVRAL
jgi:hypothetical protein